MKADKQRAKEDSQDAQIARLQAMIDTDVARNDELQKQIDFLTPNLERFTAEVEVLEKAIHMRKHLLGKRKKPVGYDGKDVVHINTYMAAEGLPPVGEDDLDLQGDAESTVVGDDEDELEDEVEEQEESGPHFLGGELTLQILEGREIAPLRHKNKRGRAVELTAKLKVKTDQWRSREVDMAARTAYDAEPVWPKDDEGVTMRVLWSERFVTVELVHPVDGQYETLGVTELFIDELLEQRDDEDDDGVLEMEDWYDLVPINAEELGQGALKIRLTLRPFKRTPKGTMNFWVHGAQDLISQKMSKKPGVFVKAFLESNSSLATKEQLVSRTTTLVEQKELQWSNCEYNFRTGKLNTEVIVEAFIYGGPGKKDVSLGSAIISLQDKTSGERERVWVDLSGWDESQVHEPGSATPRVEVSFQFSDDALIEMDDAYFGGRVALQVLQARNLGIVDRGKKGFGGTTNPFAKVLLGKDSDQIVVGKTPVVKQTLDPVWVDQRFDLKVPPTQKEFNVEVFGDRKVGGPASVGISRVLTPALVPGETVTDWYPLFSAGANKPAQGAVQLAVTLTPLVPIPKGTLILQVHAAKGLLAKDMAKGKKGKQAEKTSDPFVSLMLLEHSSSRQKKFGKTPVMKKTLDPEWEDKVFQVKVGRANDDVLVSVLDYDGPAKKSEELGTLVIPIQDHIDGETQRAWFDLLPPPKSAPDTLCGQVELSITFEEGDKELPDYVETADGEEVAVVEAAAEEAEELEEKSEENDDEKLSDLRSLGDTEGGDDVDADQDCSEVDD